MVELEEPRTRARMSGFLPIGADTSRDYILPTLHCPHGHVIKWENAFLEAGYPRCKERSGAGHSICNARLFVVIYPRVNPLASPMVFVAEISYQEIMHVTKLGMDVPAIMSYLGVTWAPTRKAG